MDQIYLLLDKFIINEVDLFQPETYVRAPTIKNYPPKLDLTFNNQCVIVVKTNGGLQ